MRLLLLVDPNIPVPPVQYGGTERIAALLAEGLVEAGHTVDLLAGPGSQKYNGCLQIHYKPGSGRISRAYRKILFRFRSGRLARSADLVLNFGRLDYLGAIAGKKLPLISVFQNPIPPSEIEELQRRFPQRLGLVGISRQQIAHLKSARAIRVIYNATDVERMPFQERVPAESYFVYLGRLTSNKGVHLAIAAAQAAGVPLKIAGPQSKEPGEENYFEREIAPHLDSRIEYIGSVNDEQKSHLLGQARALLFPIQWPEPFGIVMAEALACGCPVIGWNNGSVPEVIQSQRNGFVVNSVPEMVAAIQNIDSISRRTCRQDAEERFSKQAMIGQYLQLVEQLRAE
ncbi:glycosyltransferase family 4 protein [Telmatocola sphagniphila]|uniref:Glycosyltransferase family 4 protein n=1 Tax=Telmatocola sphagniphila TaxID=1123043 RepID=A0A8E6B9J2_9BACT|nr:glycosyltransferase family 4 protein [Telmatocola sphagniphila]QVL33774.1 glycosyltransferase family 4 protein [Telmatocola sphagniphila]